MVIERMAVGVEVERRPARNKWQDHVWRAVALTLGTRDLADWSVLSEHAGVTRFFAGSGEIVAHSSDTKVYKDNLEAPRPSVYVVLRRGGAPSGWRLYLVTVDPSEAHAHADVGEDRVEALPMPGPVGDWLRPFVARHHVERPEWKRQRDRSDPALLAGRADVTWESEDE